MLTELAVQNLGVIADLRLVFHDGMTVVTGETGAGKTLIVDAIALLAGGRADSGAVRQGADEAVIEGRFVVGSDDAEVVVRRIVPAKGRSRAYVDGHMATVATLADMVTRHVDLYAQHAQHSLLTTSGQRAALDRFAATDLAPLEQARAHCKEIEDALASIGGDVATREREIELLRFQVAELDAAHLVDPDEDEHLAVEQAALTDVAANRAAADGVCATLVGDDGVTEGLSSAISSLAASDVFADERARLGGLAAELDDVASELRRRAEAIVADPERLDVVMERRQLIARLRRRHGDGTVAGVIAAHRAMQSRLADLEDAGGRITELTAALDAARDDVAAAAAVVEGIRRSAAPKLATAVEGELRRLAMPAACFSIDVGEREAGSDVTMLFGANPGMAPVPLARSASGGELARAMLALRLLAISEQATVVFDEIDAGIGGNAALAVGDALARLGRRRQVLVVTHLAQVAAAADQQIRVLKVSHGDQTSTAAAAVTGEERVVELSRMLSGRPSSDSARAHARELLGVAGARGGDG